MQRREKVLTVCLTLKRPSCLCPAVPMPLILKIAAGPLDSGQTAFWEHQTRLRPEGCLRGEGPVVSDVEQWALTIQRNPSGTTTSDIFVDVPSRLLFLTTLSDQSCCCPSLMCEVSACRHAGPLMHKSPHSQLLTCQPSFTVCIPNLDRQAIPE